MIKCFPFRRQLIKRLQYSQPHITYIIHRPSVSTLPVANPMSWTPEAANHATVTAANPVPWGTSGRQSSSPWPGIASSPQTLSTQSLRPTQY